MAATINKLGELGIPTGVWDGLHGDFHYKGIWDNGFTGYFLRVNLLYENKAYGITHYPHGAYVKNSQRHKFIYTLTNFKDEVLIDCNLTFF